MNINSNQVANDNVAQYKAYSSSLSSENVQVLETRKPVNKEVTDSKFSSDVNRKLNNVTESKSPVSGESPLNATGKEGDENNIQIFESSVNNTVSQVNKRLKPVNTEIQYSYHEATKQISFKVLNKETGEIIREIPSEKVLDMLEKMWEMAGILIDEKR